MCNFTITFTGSAADFVNTIRNKILDAGGTFHGDETNGEFSVPTPVGKIEGNYYIHGNDVTINITKKPFLVSCDAIEEYIKNSL